MSNKEYFAYMDRWLEKKRKEIKNTKFAVVKKKRMIKK